MAVHPGHFSVLTPGTLGPRPVLTPAPGDPKLKKVNTHVTPANDSLANLKEVSVKNFEAIVDKRNVIVTDRNYFNCTPDATGVSVEVSLMETHPGRTCTLSFALIPAALAPGDLNDFFSVMQNGQSAAYLDAFIIDSQEFELWVLTVRD